MKLFTYTFCVCSLIIMSCGKEDSLADSVLGLWNISNITVSSMESDESINVDFTNGCGSFFGDDVCFSLDFKDEGRVFNLNTEDGFDDSSWATYMVDESTGIISVCDEECLDLQLSGNIMTSTRNLDESIIVMTLTKQ